MGAVSGGAGAEHAPAMALSADSIILSALSQGFTVIGIARHGETAYNKENKAQGGMSDIPLNETGIAQAEALATKVGTFSKKIFDKNPSYLARTIYPAHLKRTIQTVAPLQQYLKSLGIEKPSLEPDARLRERDLGTAEGISNSIKEIRDALDLFLDDKSDAIWGSSSGVEGAEAPISVAKRMEESLIEIAEKHPSQFVVAISSGKAARIALATLAKNVEEREIPEALKNGEMIYLLYKKSDGDKRFIYLMRETLDGKITLAESKGPSSTSLTKE